MQPHTRLYLNVRARLLVSGMRDSSVVCSLHLSTPTSLLRGKDFSVFFSPMIDSAANIFLSTLGCVCEGKNSMNPPREVRLSRFLLRAEADPPAAAVLCCRCC